MYNSQREPGKEHIPRYTPGFIALRIIQLVLAIIILGLTAYGLAVLPFIGDGLMVFTSLITVIITIWLTCAHSCAPGAFNYWATLFFDVWLFLWWLISMGALAAETAVFFAGGVEYCSVDDDFCGTYDLYGPFLTWGAVKAAAAGLAGLEFLLFFISLIINAVSIHRHRRAGLHSRKVRGGMGGGVVGSPASFQMQQYGPNKPDYQAVPQQGIPFNQQDTAYSPQGMYNPPPPGAAFPPTGQPQPQFPGQAQSYYGPGSISQQQPGFIAPQHTGGSFVKSASPGIQQSPYHSPTPEMPAPYQPPQQGFNQPHQPPLQQPTPHPY